MNNQETLIASKNYIESMRCQAETLLETGSLFILGRENVEAIKEEAEKLFKCIENREIPESISTLFLNSTFGKTAFREYYITEVGFNVVTKEFARGLTDKLLKDKKCLEVMSGTGALAKALRECDVDIIATDDYSGITFYPLSDRLWTEVEKLDSLEAVKKYGKDIDYLLMSWVPNHSEIGYETMKLLHEINPDCKLIIIGEEYAFFCSTSTEKFRENINIIDSYANYIDGDNMTQEEFVHINFMNNLILGGRNETVYYKTWGTMMDCVYLAEYMENNNIEGEDEGNEK